MWSLLPPRHQGGNESFLYSIFWAASPRLAQAKVRLVLHCGAASSNSGQHFRAYHIFGLMKEGKPNPGRAEGLILALETRKKLKLRRRWGQVEEGQQLTLLSVQRRDWSSGSLSDLSRVMQQEGVETQTQALVTSPQLPSCMLAGARVQRGSCPHHRKEAPCSPLHLSAGDWDPAEILPGLASQIGGEWGSKEG